MTAFCHLCSFQQGRELALALVKTNKKKKKTFTDPPPLKKKNKTKNNTFVFPKYDSTAFERGSKEEDVEGLNNLGIFVCSCSKASEIQRKPGRDEFLEKQDLLIRIETI